VLQRQRYLAIIAAVVLLPLVALQVYAVVYYEREQATLIAYLHRVTNSSLSPSEQIQEIVLSLKDKPDNGNDSYFLCPLFRPLRPTPSQVLEKGGDCADRSRVVVALLRLRGISSSKWALYNAQGESVHAVVQADTELGKMVVDPLFGIWFPKTQGGYYGIGELKQDPGILAKRIHELEAKGLEPGADRLETYEWNQYIYTNARTINWNKSALMKASYELLHFLLGEKVDELRRPTLAEEPALMVLYGTAGLEVVIVLAWLAVARLKRTQRAAVHVHAIVARI
jgi:hypothetical protein